MVFMNCFLLIPTILTKIHFTASKIVYSGNTSTLFKGNEVSKNKEKEGGGEVFNKIGEFSEKSGNSWFFYYLEYKADIAIL